MKFNDELIRTDNFIPLETVYGKARLVVLKDRKAVMNEPNDAKKSYGKHDFFPRDYNGIEDPKYPSGVFTGYIGDIGLYLVILDIDYHDKGNEIPITVLEPIIEKFKGITHVVSSPTGSGHHIYLFSEKEPKLSKKNGTNIEYLTSKGVYACVNYRFNGKGEKEFYEKIGKDQVAVYESSDDILRNILNYLSDNGYYTNSENGEKEKDKYLTEIIDILDPYFLDGQRSDMTLAVSGYLYKKGFNKEKVLKVIKILVKGNPDYEKHIQTVESTFKKNLDEVTGYDLLKSYMTDDELKKLETLVGGKESDEVIDTQIGIDYLSNLDEDFSKHLESIFEGLFPENGELMALIWSSAVSTVRGEANIVIIEGNSGEGKSVLMEYVLDFIPEKYIIRLNKATLPALLTRTYKEGSDYLDKKIIYLGDLGSRNTFEESEELRTILRILLTDKHWAREITDYKETKDNISEKVVLNEELIGSPAMWFTTVIAERDDQDNDRSIIGTVNLNKSDQIIDLIQHLRNNKSKTTLRIKALLEEKIPIVHSIFESLVQSEDEVIIPYRVADFKKRFRDSKKIVDLTTLLALVNKDRRGRYGEFILPGRSDISQVLGLLEKGSGNIKEITNKRLNQIFKEYEYNQFNRNDVMVIKGFNDVFSRSDVVFRELIRPAIKEGYIEECEELGERNAKLYQFVQAPQSQLMTYNVPEIDYAMLKSEYGNHEFLEPVILEKAEA